MASPADARIAVLVAISEGGEDGISAAAAATAIATTERPTSNDRADAGRAIRALLVEGLIESVRSDAGTRFLCTPLGFEESEGLEAPVIQPRADPRRGAAGPVVDKLPPPPPDATPEEIQRHSAARGRKADDDFVELPEHLVELMNPDERRRYRLYQARHHEDDWRVWVPAMFPSSLVSPAGETAPFAPHHEVLLDHAWDIERGEPSDPHVDVWNRGGMKSTLAEIIVASLGIRKKRRYCLYVSGTQNLAEEHVGNISTLLGSELVALAYPDFAERAVSQYGTAKGWSRKRLFTKAGFVVDALGLDVAARGIKVDEQRPDLIIFDDIDDTDDTPATVKKKIRAITRKIIPAGSQDVAVIAVQNKVHSNSIFARLISKGGPTEPPPADFLQRRKTTGPIPALYDPVIEQRADDEGGGWEIKSGRPSWLGMDIPACQHMLDQYGYYAFMAECQHEEEDLTGGMFDHLDFSNPDRGGTIRVMEANCPSSYFVSCVWVDPAISSTDKSDSMGIVADSLGLDPLTNKPKMYRRWAWEKITNAEDALKQAFLIAVEIGAEVVGVETDQGGDTWEPVYWLVVEREVERIKENNDGQLPDGFVVPRYAHEKAGSTGKSKVERAQQMRVDYDLHFIKHVESGCVALERGLRRFPLYKPFDCVDAGYWGWKWMKDWLAQRGGVPSAPGGEFKARAPQGAVGEVSAGNIL